MSDLTERLLAYCAGIDGKSDLSVGLLMCRSIMKEAVDGIEHLLSRVSQLESDCRMKDEALRAAKDDFVSIEEYWNGGSESAVDAAEESRDRAAAAIKKIEAALSPAPQPDTEGSCYDSGGYPPLRQQPDAVQADETAWLIEFSEKVSRTPAYYGHTGEGLGETTDSLKAVRFSRREDAQAIIDDIGWNEARPVEHMWADGKCCNGLSPEECAQVPGRHCDGLQPASPPPADGGRNG